MYSVELLFRRQSSWPTHVSMRGAVARPAGAGAARPAGSRGRAIEVPGLSALNEGGYAEVDSVSCAPAGTCAAGGSFSDRHGHSQGFVVSRPRRPRA